MIEQQNKKIVIVPCSGIGKAFGTVSRETTYLVVEELAKGKADTICLPLLLVDEEARKLVSSNPCITIDGCALDCAKKNVEFVGGRVQKAFRVLEAIKKNRNLTTKGITQIDENGKKLAYIIAKEVRRELEKTETKEEVAMSINKAVAITCSSTFPPKPVNGGRKSFNKVGIISCSGEDCIEGTLSRIATRIVLERLRPHHTVTICLPLFLAGGLEERTFASIYPTITIDGCSKKCAKIGTEKYSGQVADSIVVTELLDRQMLQAAGSRRELNSTGIEMVARLAEEVSKKVDNILGARRSLD